MKMKSVIRTKTYYCGKNDLEIDLFPWMEVEKRYTRKKKEKVTIPKQKVLNDKNFNPRSPSGLRQYKNKL